jgi:hypothetical protein
LALRPPEEQGFDPLGMLVGNVHVQGDEREEYDSDQSPGI